MLRDSFIRYLIVAFGFMIFMAVSLGNAKEQDVTLKGFGSAFFDAMDGTLDYAVSYTHLTLPTICSV